MVIPHQERPSFVLGTYERHVVAAMRAHLRAGMVAYDVGAHVGYLTLTLSSLVGPSGAVVAIEADPRNRSMLETNIATNRVSNVRVVPFVISDAQGTTRFATFSTYSSVSHIADAATPGDAEILDVPSTTLDELVYREGYPRPALVKIDVEGAEVRVLRGAARLLREARPIIIAEARRSATLDELIGLTEPRGYQAQVLAGDPHLEADGIVDVLFLPTNAGVLPR
jgi:FkbM family methyltransferase